MSRRVSIRIGRRPWTAAALFAIAVSASACGKANVSTPEPGEGAAGVVASEGDAAQTSATPEQTPSYGQAGAAPAEVHASPGSPPPDTEPQHP
jgi:hypothetical protein